MTLKEFLSLNIINDTFNLNTEPNGRYGMLGHDYCSLNANKLDRRARKYLDCEITNIYGFDDGLTITVDGTELNRSIFR